MTSNRDLLPGVIPGGCEPTIVCDSRSIVRRARRMALLRDAAQLFLVIAVDWLFYRWPLSRLPWAGRDESLMIVIAFNALVVGHVFFSLKLPEWNARRVASTWCATERKRFATTMPQRDRR